MRPASSAPVILLRPRGPLPPGLRRRVDAKGRVRYKIDIKSRWIPGGRIARWLGAVSREEAEARLREVASLILSTRLGLPLPDPATAVPSFADIAGRHVAELRDLNRRDRAIETAEGHIPILAAHLGRKPIAAITPEEIEAVRGELLRPTRADERPRSGRTVLHYL